MKRTAPPQPDLPGLAPRPRTETILVPNADLGAAMRRVELQGGHVEWFGPLRDRTGYRLRVRWPANNREAGEE